MGQEEDGRVDGGEDWRIEEIDAVGLDKLKGIRVDASPEHIGGIVVVVEVGRTSTQRLDGSSRQYNGQSQAEHTGGIAEEPLQGL